MVYTELAPRRHRFHVAPAMPALKYTSSDDIHTRAIKKTYRITCERSESAQRERRIALYKRSSINQSMGAGIAQWLERRTRD